MGGLEEQGLPHILVDGVRGFCQLGHNDFQRRPFNSSPLCSHAATDSWHFSFQKICKGFQINLLTPDVSLSSFILSLSPSPAMHLPKHGGSDKLTTHASAS